jgi:hypothetical protein
VRYPSSVRVATAAGMPAMGASSRSKSFLVAEIRWSLTWDGRGRPMCRSMSASTVGQARPRCSSRILFPHDSQTVCQLVWMIHLGQYEDR